MTALTDSVILTAGRLVLIVGRDARELDTYTNRLVRNRDVFGTHYSYQDDPTCRTSPADVKALFYGLEREKALVARLCVMVVARHVDPLVPEVVQQYAEAARSTGACVVLSVELPGGGPVTLGELPLLLGAVPDAIVFMVDGEPRLAKMRGDSAVPQPLPTEADLDWPTLLRLEPNLGALYRDIETTAKDVWPWSDWCAGEYWGRTVKPRMSKLVGWNRPRRANPDEAERLLRSMRAYEIATATFEAAVPRCGPCGCWS